MKKGTYIKAFLIISSVALVTLTMWKVVAQPSSDLPKRSDSSAQRSVYSEQSVELMANAGSGASLSVTNEMTLEELAKYNGKNGQPSYIAVDGIIYDVSQISAWSKGTHMGYSAGGDLTEAFKSSPHAMSILDNAVIIGKLVAFKAAQTDQPNGTTVTAPDQTDNRVNGQAAQPKEADTSSYPVFSLVELEKYNGKNGQPAYIAVDGIVYDVSALGSWRNGSHQGYAAGADLTQAFATSPHSQSILNNADIIGILEGTKITGNELASLITSSNTTGNGETNVAFDDDEDENDENDEDDEDDEDDDDDNGDYEDDDDEDDDDDDDHDDDDEHDGDDD